MKDFLKGINLFPARLTQRILLTSQFFFFSVQEFIISVHNLDSGSQITLIIETEERLIFRKKKTELSNSLSPYK